MNTPNNAAALERLEQKWREEINAFDEAHIDSFDPEDWMAGKRECADELAALRATLAQPDALTSQPSGEAVAWPERMVNLPCPDGTTDRIVGFRVEEGSQILGKFGLSEPIAWLRSVTVDRHTHPSADAPGVAVDEWRPIESAPKSVADGSRVSGVYLLGFVPDEEIDFDPNACIDIVWWEPLLANKAGTRGKWCRSAGSTVIECKPTHWRPLPAPPAALAPKPEGEL